jgi:hypothetical protein
MKPLLALGVECDLSWSGSTRNPATRPLESPTIRLLKSPKPNPRDSAYLKLPITPKKRRQQIPPIIPPLVSPLTSPLFKLFRRRQGAFSDGISVEEASINIVMRTVTMPKISPSIPPPSRPPPNPGAIHPRMLLPGPLPSQPKSPAPTPLMLPSFPPRSQANTPATTMLSMP